MKVELQKTGYIFYLVRGNHEKRPTDIEEMLFEYDGEVYQAACCLSRLYGMNKCYEIVRVG